MPEAYLGEIRLVGFNFNPRGWASCDGQILQINQNQSLFSLLGTVYGGDGRTTFALPDLRGRVPIHFGAGYALGARGGQETVPLSEGQMPAHTHEARATSAQADSINPSGRLLGQTGGSQFSITPYGDPIQPTELAPGTLANAGGGQGHPNMQPSTTIHFIIALSGIFPP